MMGSRSRLAYVMTVVLIGSLAVIGQLDGVEAGRSYRDGGHAIADDTMIGTGANATAAWNESKLRLRFCLVRDCKDKGEAFVGRCICCLTLPDVPCWGSLDECDAACPVCDPDCPTYPPPPEPRL